MTKSDQGTNRTVFDERGHRYKLTKKIGEGGQGVVCSTDHDNVLVKVCTRPKSDRDKWMAHIRWLMQQDLDSLNIARPVARIVKPQQGYVMELMDGLQPLDDLMEATEVGLQESGVEAYLEQGGIKRRLKLMARLARTLSDLHGRGMAFGDLSPANVFISRDVKHAELWLIDCDNICVDQRASFDIIEPGKEARGRVYTPFYGAPEVVTGGAHISSLTDCWSFAVMVFRLLTALHPFIGDMVSDGEPELEEDALAGRLPWVDHPEDRLNSASLGLPRELVLLEPFRLLFERCFNAGRDDPLLRPSMSEWAETLEHCYEWLVDCPECGSSYFYQPVKGELSCGFCDTSAQKNSLLFLRHYIYDPTILNIEDAIRSDCWIDTSLRQVVNVGTKATVKTSPPGSGFYDTAQSYYELSLTENGLRISPAIGVQLKIKLGGGKAQSFSTPFELKPEERQSRKVYVMPDSASSGIHDICVFKW